MALTNMRPSEVLVRGLGVWRMRDGMLIRIVDMETSHIQNSLKMLRKAGFISPSEKSQAFEHYPSFDPDSMAQMYAEQEYDHLHDIPVSRSIDEFLVELKKRGVKENK